MCRSALRFAEEFTEGVPVDEHEDYDGGESHAENAEAEDEAGFGLAKNRREGGGELEGVALDQRGGNLALLRRGGSHQG